MGLSGPFMGAPTLDMRRCAARLDLRSTPSRYTPRSGVYQKGEGPGNLEAEIPLRYQLLHANNVLQRLGMPGPIPPLSYKVQLIHVFSTFQKFAEHILGFEENLFRSFNIALGSFSVLQF